MATFDTSKSFTQCPVCLKIDEHQIGFYKARQDERGYLFDADLPDAQALLLTSRKFKEYALVNCKGEITRSCTENYIQQELFDPSSPLSTLMARRIKAFRCTHCGFLQELPKLP